MVDVQLIALRQADRLSRLDGAALEAFCIDIGMAASAATEARKMFALASVIKEQTEAKRSSVTRL